MREKLEKIIRLAEYTLSSMEKSGSFDPGTYAAVLEMKIQATNALNTVDF